MTAARPTAFRMYLLPGCADEYRRRHDAIWPELVTALKDAGIGDYSIHLDADERSLFATLTIASQDRFDALPDMPVMRRWWTYMSDIMETDATSRPVTVPLAPMFHLP